MQGSGSDVSTVQEINYNEANRLLTGLGVAAVMTTPARVMHATLSRAGVLHPKTYEN